MNQALYRYIHIMEYDLSNLNDKKQCPFCAEVILAKAIKCRYCGEFLNTPKADLLNKAKNTPNDSDLAPDSEDDETSFVAVPSLFGMIPTFIKAAVFLAIAGCLMFYPFENWIKKSPSHSENAQSQIDQNSAGFIPSLTSDINPKLVKKYRTIAGSALTALITLILLLKMVNLKCIRYEITPDRIEFSRGILDRKVDNIDMFRVVDISLRRSIFDCIFGIGSIKLVTSDKTDPDFSFLKVHQPRQIYDLIKTASLEADKKNSVIHVEN